MNSDPLVGSLSLSLGHKGRRENSGKPSLAVESCKKRKNINKQLVKMTGLFLLLLSSSYC